MSKLNLKKINTDHAIVTGREFTIEDCETGKVFVTNKPYIDKLFNEMGWRSLGVVKILEDFAGKVISDVGTLRESSIYVDESTDSFLVASDNDIQWVEDLYDTLDQKGYKIISEIHYNPYHSWDHIFVKSPTGTYYAIYIDLCNRYAQCFCCDYDEKVVKLKGLINEGVYQLSEGSTSLISLFVLMDNPVDISSQFTPEQKLSMREYVDLLCTLGYVKKKRDKYVMTDKGEESQTYLGNLDQVLDDCNCMSWLQRCINVAPNDFTFDDACRLISDNLVDVGMYQLKDFYQKNSSETSDMFALNY